MVDCLKFPSQIITRSTSSSVTSSARRSSCVSRHGFANMHALARREPRHAARRKPVEEFHGRARIGAARVRIPDLRGKKLKEAIGGALSGGDTSHGKSPAISCHPTSTKYSSASGRSGAVSRPSIWPKIKSVRSPQFGCASALSTRRASHSFEIIKERDGRLAVVAR
jgi:hypothetical protein